MTDKENVSLNETLSKVYDEKAIEVEETGSSVDEPIEIESKKPSETAPEDKSKTSGEEDEEAKKVVEAPEKAEIKQEVPPEEAVQLPQHWSQQERDAFGKLPADTLRLIMDKEKSIQANATTKLQQAAELTRTYGDIDRMFAPHQHQMAINGISPQAFIARALAYDVGMRQDPAGTIKQLAQNYGVDINSMNQDQEYIDPSVARLQNEIAQLRQGLNQTTQQITTQQSQQLESIVVDFSQTRDANGNLLYPHFNELSVDDLRPFMKEAKSSTEAKIILKEAYEKAVWLNPTTRQKLTGDLNKSKELTTPTIITDQKTLEEKKRTIEKENADKRAIVDKAVKASKTIENAPPVKSTNAHNLRQLLESQL